MFPSWPYVVICCLAGPLLFFVIQWAFKERDEVIQHRRVAAKLAGILRGLGLVWLPNLLESYSVGGYRAMLKQLAHTIRMFMDHPEMVVKEFDEVFLRLLVAKLKTPEGRTFIQSHIDSAISESQPKIAA